MDEPPEALLNLILYLKNQQLIPKPILKMSLMHSLVPFFSFCFPFKGIFFLLHLESKRSLANKNIKFSDVKLVFIYLLLALTDIRFFGMFYF